MKKFNSKKKTVLALACSSILIATNLSACQVSEKAKKYFEENKIFNIEKVDKMLDLWGGDERYVEYKFNMFAENPLYNHFKNKKGSPIIVKYDESVSQQDQEQFNYCFDYLNEIFKVINSDYSFIVDSNSENADIYVNCGKLTSDEVIAMTKRIFDETITSQIKCADITFNTSTKIDISNSYKRHSMMHELMHVLLASKDIDETQSETFSLYNYMDVAFMASEIESYSEEYAESFVTLLPTDLSTFISLYGDAESVEKRHEYVDLLNDTLTDCNKIFGSFQPYYEDDFEIPTHEDFKEEIKRPIQNPQIPANFKKEAEIFYDDEYCL